MIPALSTHVFLQQRLHAGLLEALQSAGVRHVEIFAARHHFDYTDRSAVHDLALFFRSNDLSASLHQPIFLGDGSDAHWSRHTAPTLNLIDPEKSQRIAAMDEVKRALEAAEQIPFIAAVLHLGLKHDAWSPRSLEHSLTAIEHLNAFAQPLGVRLLLENLNNDVTSPEHLVEILRIGHFDRAGICFDLGHAHLMEQDPEAPGLEPAFALLRSRIAQVHLHDNDGRTDQHLWPGTSAHDQNVTNPVTMDWPATETLLDSLPANTPGILEIAHDLGESLESVLAKASAIFSAQRRRTDQFERQPR